jgi:hypothetical protein
MTLPFEAEYDDVLIDDRRSNSSGTTFGLTDRTYKFLWLLNKKSMVHLPALNQPFFCLTSYVYVNKYKSISCMINILIRTHSDGVPEDRIFTLIAPNRYSI